MLSLAGSTCLLPVHCWVLQEPVLHVEDPGRGLCVLSVCLLAHTSLKEQGFQSIWGLLAALEVHVESV